MKHINRLLQDALVKYNVLSSEEVSNYLTEAQSADENLKEYLLHNGIVSEKQIVIALSQSLSLEVIDFNTVTVERAVVDLVPVRFVWYYRFMPVRLENRLLTIACADPVDVRIQDEIRTHLGYDIHVVLTEHSQLIDALKTYYGFASDTIDKMLSKDKVVGHKLTGFFDQEVEDIDRTSEDPTISSLVNKIILEAYNKRATDIHIEPYRHKVRFRYRIDGALVDAQLPDKVRHFLPQILSRIKILANLSITERRLPQDGSAVVKTKDQQLDLRISTMPTPRGESLVIRVLPTKVSFLSLENLGCNPDSISRIRGLIKKPHGIIFMTGPTGSGKTTTLYACLKEINSPQSKIITIEDPVEYEMEGITQVQINPKIKFSFSTGLRSLLRHDPDIVMVGEVRDIESAEMSIRTALTGHLVFSTLHTNDAASGITRLIDMGVEPYLVASSVEAFVAQRLVRVICPKCKVLDGDVRDEIKTMMVNALQLHSPGEVIIYKGSGCDYCNHTGYYGRVAIYEILFLNDSIRTAILEKPRSNYIKSIALREGLITLRQNGWKAVMQGITTPQEVINVTVKDEDSDVAKEQPVIGHVAAIKTVEPNVNELRPVSIKDKGTWTTEQEYESRNYQRMKVPVSVRYQLLKRDPNNPEFLLSDGIEYTAVTSDVSAGGLRFLSKTIFPVGSIFELRIQLEEGIKGIICLAKVCRIEQDSLANNYTVVNYYLDMACEDRGMINRFVKKMSASDRQELEQVS